MEAFVWDMKTAPDDFHDLLLTKHTETRSPSAQANTRLKHTCSIKLISLEIRGFIRNTKHRGGFYLLYDGVNNYCGLKEQFINLEGSVSTN